MTSRLASISQELATALQLAPLEKRRTAVMYACEFALSKTGLTSPIIRRALSAVQRARPLSKSEIMNLTAFAQQLDADYLAASSEENSNVNNAPAILALFGQARAAAALKWAVESDSLSAISEAIYEAIMVTDDRKTFIDHILNGL